MNDPKILIVAGEPSGDLHASCLVHEIRVRTPESLFFGIGGDRMRAQGVELFYHIDQMAVLGFTEIVRHLPFLRKVMIDLDQALSQRRPDLIVLVDYPGFNLRFARRARKYPIPIMYYIAPQVWAWGKGRLRQMTNLIDRMAVVFDFEEELFRSAGVDARFVGHPLLDGLKTSLDREEFLGSTGLRPEAPILGLLPGSRAQEVQRLLPEMIGTWRLLLQDVPELQAIVAAAPGVPPHHYAAAVHVPHMAVAVNQTYEVMRYSDVLLVASGTATLEAACFGTPLVVVYKVSPLSYQIGKRLVRIPDIGLVNVVAGRRIVPEFVQHRFRAEALRPILRQLLTDETSRSRMIHDLQSVRSRLGEPGAAGRAAELALELIGSKSAVSITTRG